MSVAQPAPPAKALPSRARRIPAAVAACLTASDPVARRDTYRGAIGPHQQIDLIDGRLFPRPHMCHLEAEAFGRLHSLLGLAGRVLFDVLVEAGDADVVPDLAVYPEEVAATFAPSQVIFPPPSLLVDLDRGEADDVKAVQMRLTAYARAGIDQVWVVDARREAVMVGRQPSGGRYEFKSITAGTIAPLMNSRAQFSVRDIFSNNAFDTALSRRSDLF